MAKAICPDCGKKLSDDPDNCPHCGVFIRVALARAEVAAGPPTPEAAPPEIPPTAEGEAQPRVVRRSRAPALLLTLLMVLLVGGAGYYFLALSTDSEPEGLGAALSGEYGSAEALPWDRLYRFSTGTAVELEMTVAEVEAILGLPAETTESEAGGLAYAYHPSMFLSFTDGLVSGMVVSSPGWKLEGELGCGSTELEVLEVLGQPELVAENRFIYSFSPQGERITTDGCAYTVQLHFDEETLEVEMMVISQMSGTVDPA